MLETLLFYFFSLLTLAGAVLTITRRSPVIATVWLTVSLLGVAGLFLLLGAEFLFVAQIILYIGGVTLLFLFVIMLVNLNAMKHVPQWRRTWPLAVTAVLTLAGEMILLLKRGFSAWSPLQPPRVDSTQLLADALLSKFYLAFEAISILLLVAIVGSVWMGQTRKGPAA